MHMFPFRSRHLCLPVRLLQRSLLSSSLHCCVKISLGFPRSNGLAMLSTNSGGRLRVPIGAIIQDRFKILHCISEGQSALRVGLASSRQFQAIGSSMRDFPPCECPDEAAFLRAVHSDQLDLGHLLLPEVVDAFFLKLTADGPQHRCMVSTLLGPSILSLCQPNRLSLPWDMVQKTTFSVLLSLASLHRHGIIHGDIKMRNILQALPENSIVPLVESFLNSRNQGDQTPAPILARAPVMDDLDIRLVDLDLAHTTQNSSKHAFSIQPSSLRAPEVILGAHWATPADIWNLGCLVYEMATSRSLFITSADEFTSAMHLRRMTSIFGDFPPALIADAAPRSYAYFTPQGNFKASPTSRISFEAETLSALTSKDGRLDPLDPGKDKDLEEICLFVDFLKCMLRLDPDERETAMELLGHPWL